MERREVARVHEEHSKAMSAQVEELKECVHELKKVR